MILTNVREHGYCRPIRFYHLKNIKKENLIVSFSNYALGKDITKSEELLQKMKISGSEDYAKYFQMDQIDHSTIDEVMVEIENELSGLLERVSGHENLTDFTKELENLKNEIESLNGQKRKMLIELNRAAVDMDKLGAQVRTPFEEFGKEVMTKQTSINKEFTKRSMGCLSKISQFKASVDIPPVEELDIAEKILLKKRDDLQNLVDREHRARRKCDENPDFEELVSQGLILIKEWNSLQARFQQSKLPQK